MLLPVSWLREYVSIDSVCLEDLCRKLFSCGFEVESVNHVGQFSGVVAGRIEKLYPHPMADSLQICRVDCGQHGSDIQIVTGANNIAIGQLVPVALPGAEISGGKAIREGEIRGQPSHGMLCSGAELGIDDNWYDGAGVDGILILEQTVRPGQYVEELLGLDDYVLDISITANRPDCQCILGLAREVAAAFALALNPPNLNYRQYPAAGGKLGVEIDAPALCHRYIGHMIEDVRVMPSPVLIRRRLILCGHSPINNLVDLTNYILLEIGQPMHSFDAQRLSGERILVRRSVEGEKITTLDEKTRTLPAETLLICDGAEPVAIAGIMGGAESAITPDTTRVMLECAVFEKSNIRRSSRTLGLSSDSSKRFEKGVDEYTAGIAIQRALHLVDKYNFGRVTSTQADVGGDPQGQRYPKINHPIITSVAEINSVLGIDVPGYVVRDILERLNFEVNLDGDGLTAVAPPYRTDVKGAPDLAEEVIRIYGFEHIKPSLMSRAAITPGGVAPEIEAQEKLRLGMVSAGFLEAIHFSFYSPKDLDLISCPEDAPERNGVVIENPIAEHYCLMRRTLLPSLLASTARNLKRGVLAGRLFELANIHIPIPGEELPREEKLLCFVLFGSEEDFFTAKGAVEKLSLSLNIGDRIEFVAGSRFGLHPGARADILLDGKPIGYLGQLGYPEQDAFEISRPVFVCELSVPPLLEAAPKDITFSQLPTALPISRDLALVMDDTLPTGDVEKLIKSVCPGIISIRLFDVYKSDILGGGKKSMAYTLTLEGSKPKEIESWIENILSALKSELGVHLRG